jgi:hypothetical protein
LSRVALRSRSVDAAGGLQFLKSNWVGRNWTPLVATPRSKNAEGGYWDCPYYHWPVPCCRRAAIQLQSGVRSRPRGSLRNKARSTVELQWSSVSARQSTSFARALPDSVVGTVSVCPEELPGPSAKAWVDHGNAHRGLNNIVLLNVPRLAARRRTGMTWEGQRIGQLMCYINLRRVVCGSYSPQRLVFAATVYIYI